VWAIQSRGAFNRYSFIDEQGLIEKGQRSKGRGMGLNKEEEKSL
jgi:hypothetical protein